MAIEAAAASEMFCARHIRSKGYQSVVRGRKITGFDARPIHDGPADCLCLGPCGYAVGFSDEGNVAGVAIGPRLLASYKLTAVSRFRGAKRDQQWLERGDSSPPFHIVGTACVDGVTGEGELFGGRRVAAARRSS